MSAGCCLCYRIDRWFCDKCESILCDYHNKTHKCYPVSAHSLPGQEPVIRYMSEEELVKRELTAHEIP